MGDQIAPKVLKSAVARICEGEGIDVTNHSSINTLMYLAMNHIMSISKTANETAEASGRTVTNIADLAIALTEHDESLSALNDFTKSKRKHAIKPLQNAPKFPLYPAVIMDQGPSDLVNPAKPFPAHIPPFIPPFPAEHTYKQTSLMSSRGTDTAVNDKKRALENDALEALLINTVPIESLPTQQT